MITGSQSDMLEIIMDLEGSIREWLVSERTTNDRILGCRERMSKFGAKEYYEKQILEEEELLTKIQDIRKKRESFLEELKISYNMQYGKSFLI
jgi:tryptophan 2,3-dioxygenase